MELSMKTRTLLKALLLFVCGCLIIILSNSTAGFATAAGVDKCLTCHRDFGDDHISKIAGDVHTTKGISCADCHGGDPTVEDKDAAMNPAKGYKGIPTKKDIPAVCGRCHGDPAVMKQYGSTLPVTMVAEYGRSVHAQKLQGGDPTIAQCVTCHGVHGIKKVSDPSSPVYATNVPKLCASCHANLAYMKTHDPAFPVDQYEKYQTSVHGQKNAAGDVKVATCVSCHNAHEIISGKFPLSSVYVANVPNTCAKCHGNAEYMKGYSIPTDQYAKYTESVHGKALLEKKDVSAPACNGCHGNHGATPPGISSISNVCGTCHALNAELFSQSPHKKAFDDAKMPACETCHSNHGIQPVSVGMLGVGEGAVCAQCHSASEKGYIAAAAMRSSVDSLLALQQQAEQLIGDAEQKGMEVSAAKFALKDVRQALIQTKTIVHAIDLAKLRELTSKGSVIAEKAVTQGKESVDEYYFRRRGLGVASLIITILAAAIYFKLRKSESESKGG